MNNMNNALLRFMIAPVVWKAAATSGIAGETIWDERFELKPPKERITTMNHFRRGSTGSGSEDWELGREVELSSRREVAVADFSSSERGRTIGDSVKGASFGVDDILSLTRSRVCS